MTARVLLTSVAALCLFHGSSWAVQYDALALYLDFEEGAGDTAMDASKHGNNGTLHMAEWADGKYGKAISLSGAAGGWVEVPDAPSLDIADEITLMAWVYPTAFNPRMAADRQQVLGGRYLAVDVVRLLRDGRHRRATRLHDCGRQRTGAAVPQRRNASIAEQRVEPHCRHIRRLRHAPLPGRRGGVERRHHRYDHRQRCAGRHRQKQRRQPRTFPRFH